MAGATYFWSGPNGFTSNVQNPSIPNASAAYDGTYTLVVSNSASGCSGITTTTKVSVSQVTVAGTLSGATTVCANNHSGTLSLTGYTGIIVRWESSSTGAGPWATIQETTSTLSYNDLGQSTWYRAVVKSGVCDEKISNFVKITVDDNTVGGRIAGATGVCDLTNTGVLTLTEYTGTVQRWQSSTDNGAIWTDVNHNGVQYTFQNLSVTTQFRAVVKNGTCDEAYAIPATVTVHPLPQVSFSAPTVCNGLPTVFSDQTTLVIGSVATWSWDFGNGSGSTVRNPRHTYSEAGTYSVTLTATTNKGCSATSSQSVTVASVPEVDFTFSTVCQGGPTIFRDVTALPVGTVQSYAWDFGDGAVSSDKDPSHQYAAPGQYTATLTVTSDAGCQESITQTVTVYPRATLDFTFTNACLGDRIAFRNNSNILTGSVRYRWDFGDGTTSTSINPEHIYATAGTYTVRLESTSDQGCIDFITRDVTVYPEPTAAFDFEDVCKNAPAVFTNQSVVSSGILSYRWDFGDGTISTQESPVHDYAAPGTYEIVLVVETDQGCTASVREKIDVYPGPPPTSTSATCAMGQRSRLKITPLARSTVYNFSGTLATVVSPRWPTPRIPTPLPVSTRCRLPSGRAVSVRT